MRAVIQRVARAIVTVGQESVGRIDAGLFVLAGVAVGDGPDDVKTLAEKIRYLRIFNDAAGKMNLDVAQVGGGVLVVSNFTLLADTRYGRRPAFTGAADPTAAEALYRQLCDSIQALGVPVAMGRFREHMRIEIVNDGPVTIVLDTRATS